MSESERKSLVSRLSSALRVLRADVDNNTRAIIPTTYPTQPAGQQQMALIRTANPGEYRYDGATVRNQGFNRHPVVHACMRVIADVLSSVPLVVLTERGNYETRVGDDHPLQKLLDYPGPRFTARQFRARFAVDFLGYGNAFFQIERAAPGRPPVGLRAINAESMQQVWIDPEGDPRRYDYANWAGIIVNVPVEDMLHFRDLDMGRPFEAEVFGYPRGATAIGSLLADNEATQYVRQVVTNDGTPTFAVLLSDEATAEDALAMQERYKSRVVDRGKRGTPAFFGSVSDIKPLGFTLRDLEFPDLRRVSREDICAAFGVDPRMIGIASASSDAGLSGVQYAEARARLVQHTIEPMFSALEDELNHWLAPEFGDVWVTYDHDKLRDLVENDTETSTRIRAEYAQGLRTWEESRSALRLSPVPEPTDTILQTMGQTMVPAAIAVIDPNAITAEPPQTDNETPSNGATVLPVGAPTTGVVEDIQAQALNGAQISSLVEMLTLLATQQLPAQTIEALIKTSFPLVPDSLVQQMLSGFSGFSPSPVVDTTTTPSTTPTSAPASAPTAEMDEAEEDEEEEGDVEMEEEDAEEEDAEEEDSEDALDTMRADAVSNFPEAGDDKKVSLRNSQWTLFPVAEAEELKEKYPAIWRKGGNIRGNSQFAKLAPIAKRGGAPDGESEENAIRLREAWGARHKGDNRIAGVVAQVKWLVVGSRGLDFMRSVLNEAKAKERDKASRSSAVLTDRMAKHRAYWERAMQELDSTEERYKSTAAAQFARERKQVTRAIETADSAAVAKGRVRKLYADDGAFETDWQDSFEPLIARTYQSGAKQVAGVGASIPAVLNDSTVRAEPKVTKLGKKDDISAAKKALSAPQLKANALKAIDRRAKTLARHVGRTTANEVLAAIRAGEEAAMSVEEIARLVGRAVYGEERVDARTTMIARTEAAGAMSQGSWDQARAEGDLFKTKTWLSFEDERTRDSHALLNGTSLAMEEPFSTINGTTMMFPLDDAATGADTAADVINCRCVLAYETE